jgi:hypothetical protein
LPESIARADAAICGACAPVQRAMPWAVATSGPLAASPGGTVAGAQLWPPSSLRWAPLGVWTSKVSASSAVMALIG